VKWICECGADFPETEKGKAFWKLMDHIKQGGGVSGGHRRLGLFDDDNHLLAKNTPEAVDAGLIEGKGTAESGSRAKPEPEESSDTSSTPGKPGHSKATRGSNAGQSWQDSAHQDFMKPEVKSRGTAKLTFDVGGGKLQFPHWVLAYAMVLMPNFLREDGENYSHSAEGFSNFITDTLRDSFRRLLPFAMRDRLATSNEASRELVVKSYIATLESLDDVQLASFIVQGAEKINPGFAKQVRDQLDEAAVHANIDSEDGDEDAEGEGDSE